MSQADTRRMILSRIEAGPSAFRRRRTHQAQSVPDGRQRDRFCCARRLGRSNRIHFVAAGAVPSAASGGNFATASTGSSSAPTRSVPASRMPSRK